MSKLESPAHKCSDKERDESLAQDRLLFSVQTTLQELLNEQGLKYRDLARRMAVSEARVSQLFGDDASNLTIRSIAKIFFHLNEKPLLMSASEFNRRVAEARGQADTRPLKWTVSQEIRELMVSSADEFDVMHEPEKEVSAPAATPRDWALAERAVEQRSQAA